MSGEEDVGGGQQEQAGIALNHPKAPKVQATNGLARCPHPQDLMGSCGLLFLELKTPSFFTPAPLRGFPDIRRKRIFSVPDPWRPCSPLGPCLPLASQVHAHRAILRTRKRPPCSAPPPDTAFATSFPPTRATGGFGPSRLGIGIAGGSRFYLPFLRRGE